MFPGLIFDMFLYLASIFGRTGAIVVLAVGGILILIFGYWVACMFTESLFGPTHIPEKSKSHREQLALLDDAAFTKRLEKARDDPTTLREHCSRLKRNGDHVAYARELERYFSLGPKIEIEERCMLHHQLADVYLGPLERPKDAERVLKEFLREFPNSKQAGLMKERLQRVEVQITNS